MIRPTALPLSRERRYGARRLPGLVEVILPVGVDLETPSQDKAGNARHEDASTKGSHRPEPAVIQKLDNAEATQDRAPEQQQPAGNNQDVSSNHDHRRAQRIMT
ncbi:MAG: hypothetical protein ACK5BN_20415 [Planctomycetota bacterium]